MMYLENRKNLCKASHKAFKTSKGFGDLLPLSKWDREKVMGKILYNTICTIFGVEFRGAIKEGCDRVGLSSSRTISNILGKVKSVIGLVKGNGDIKAEAINKQAHECFELLGMQLPTFQKVGDMRNKILATGQYKKSFFDRTREAEGKRVKDEEKIAKKAAKSSTAGTAAGKDPVPQSSAPTATDNQEVNMVGKNSVAQNLVPATGVNQGTNKAASSDAADTGKRKRGRTIGSKDKKPRKRREHVDLESNI